MKLRSGSLLREMMRTHDFTGSDVARAAGCHRSFISALVVGRKNSCTPTIAENIAGYFGVPVEHLFMPQVSTGSASDSNSPQKNVAA